MNKNTFSIIKRRPARVVAIPLDSRGSAVHRLKQNGNRDFEARLSILTLFLIRLENALKNIIQLQLKVYMFRVLC